MNDSRTKLISESARYTKSQYGASDAAKEFKRRHNVTYKDPTPEQWRAYHEAVAHLEALYKYEGFFGGHDGPEIDEPHPTRHVEYTETVEEWKARIAKLLVSTGGTLPADLNRVYSADDYRTHGLPLPERIYGWSWANGYSRGGHVLGFPTPDITESTS